jgi:tripartite-type tricarboxylate transporter receptor subunit TctC
MPRAFPKQLRVLGVLLTVLMLFTVVRLASAQNYPTKPVHVIVPFAPGGGSDFIARFMAQRLSESLGKPFVVENKQTAIR